MPVLIFPLVRRRLVDHLAAGGRGQAAARRQPPQDAVDPEDGARPPPGLARPAGHQRDHAAPAAARVREAPARQRVGGAVHW